MSESEDFEKGDEEEKIEAAQEDGVSDVSLEDRLGLKVVRIDKDTLIAKISSLHIALKDHKFAEEVNERGEKLYVYVEGRLRVVVDKSHGFNEYEAVDSVYSIPDGSKLGDLTKATITGKFDYEKDQQLLHGVIKAVSEQAKESLKTQKQVTQIAEQLNIHAPYLSAWQTVAGAISDPIKRMRAKKAIEDLGQKKL